MSITKTECGFLKNTVGTVYAPDLTQGEKDAIRHNWAYMGCTHWFNDYGIEYWKTPCGETLEFYEW